MVKNIAAIAVLFTILFGISIYEIEYINKEFYYLEEQATILSRKTIDEEATSDDAKALKIYWDKAKKKLMMWVPHNDALHIDLALAETIGALEEKDFNSAYPRTVLLKELYKKFPSSYSVSWENIL